MAEHTQTPWKVVKQDAHYSGEHFRIVSAKDSTLVVARTYGNSLGDKDDAAFIVEACNAYASLRADLSLAKEEIERLKAALEQTKITLSYYKRLDPLLEKHPIWETIDAALSPPSTGSGG